MNMEKITLFHVTTDKNADSIIANGFRDTTADYMIGKLTTGVWVSDRVLTCNEGASGDAILRIDGLAEELLADYEWVEEGKTYREWQVPAELLNSFGKVSRFIDNDDYEPYDDATGERPLAHR